jgi:hypothetical protein
LRFSWWVGLHSIQQTWFFSQSPKLLGFRAWRRRRRSLDIIVLSGRRNNPANSKP